MKIHNVQKFLPLKVIVFVVFICSLFIILRNRFCPVFLNDYWPKDPFEIEILGSLIIALLVARLLKMFEENSDFSKNQKAIKSYFDTIIKQDLRNGFNRLTNNLNVSTASNSKFYFDNSHINNIYDIINKHIKNIYKYREYSSAETQLTGKLINFYYEMENRYITGETLDVLLIRYGKLKFITDTCDDKSLSEKVIFYKATKIAEYPEKQVKGELYNKEKLDNLMTHAPSDDYQKSIVEQIYSLTNTIISMRNVAKSEANEIKKLIK